MKRSKKVFAGAAVVFILLLFVVSYDIAKRTTFPGSKGQLKERLNDHYDAENASGNRGVDSVGNDSAANIPLD